MQEKNVERNNIKNAISAFLDKEEPQIEIGPKDEKGSQFRLFHISHSPKSNFTSNFSFEWHFNKKVKFNLQCHG